MTACRTEVVGALLELVGALEAGGTSSADLRLAAHDDALWAQLVSFSGSKRIKVGREGSGGLPDVGVGGDQGVRTQAQRMRVCVYF